MWNRVYNRRNRRTVAGLPATHAGKRLLLLSTCASLDQQPAPGGLAGRNTCSGTPTCVAHPSGAGGTVGAEGTRWLQHVQRGADLDCANGGRLACSANHLKPCSISRLELPHAPDAFPLWPRWTRERGWPPFSKLFPNVGPTCPPITNDQALAIVSVHLFCFPLVFSFASSAKGQRSVPS